jgi:hypothetical protein
MSDALDPDLAAALKTRAQRPSPQPAAPVATDLDPDLAAALRHQKLAAQMSDQAGNFDPGRPPVEPNHLQPFSPVAFGKAAGYGAANSIIPALFGLGGEAAGGLTGPAAVVASPSLAAVFSRGGQRLQEALLPKEWMQESAAAAEASPMGYKVGSLPAMFLGAKPVTSRAALMKDLPKKVGMGAFQGVVGQGANDLLDYMSATGEPLNAPPGAIDTGDVPVRTALQALRDYASAAAEGGVMGTVTTPNKLGNYLGSRQYRQELANQKAARRVTDVFLPEDQRAAALTNLETLASENAGGVKLLSGQHMAEGPAGQAPGALELLDYTSTRDTSGSLNKRQNENYTNVVSNVNEGLKVEPTATPEHIQQAAFAESEARAKQKAASEKAVADANAAKAALDQEVKRDSSPEVQQNASIKARTEFEAAKKAGEAKEQALRDALPADLQLDTSNVLDVVNQLRNAKVVGAEPTGSLDTLAKDLSIDPTAPESGPRQLSFKQLFDASKRLGAKISGLRTSSDAEKATKMNELGAAKTAIDKALYETGDYPEGHPLKEYRDYYRDEFAPNFVHDEAGKLSKAGDRGGQYDVYAENTLDRAFGKGANKQDAEQFSRVLSQTPEGRQAMSDYLRGRFASEIKGDLTPQKMQDWATKNGYLLDQAPEAKSAFNALQKRVQDTHSTADRWAEEHAKTSSLLKEEPALARFTKVDTADYRGTIRKMLSSEGSANTDARKTLEALTNTAAGKEAFLNEAKQYLRDEVSTKSLQEPEGASPVQGERNITKTSLGSKLVDTSKVRVLAETIFGKDSPEMKTLDQAYAQLNAISRQTRADNSKTQSRAEKAKIADDALEGSVLQTLGSQGFPLKQTRRGIEFAKSIWGSSPQPEQVRQLLVEAHLDPTLMKEFLRPAKNMTSQRLEKLKMLVSPYIRATAPEKKDEEK